MSQGAFPVEQPECVKTWTSTRSASRALGTQHETRCHRRPLAPGIPGRSTQLLMSLRGLRTPISFSCNCASVARLRVTAARIPRGGGGPHRVSRLGPCGPRAGLVQAHSRGTTSRSQTRGLDAAVAVVDTLVTEVLESAGLPDIRAVIEGLHFEARGSADGARSPGYCSYATLLSSVLRSYRRCCAAHSRSGWNDLRGHGFCAGRAGPDICPIG